MIDAIIKEIDLRHTYLDDRMLKSIYFGGGTPSLLSGDEVRLIISKVKEYYTINSQTEITLEANPDDISSPYLDELLTNGVNRLSIGIQSFQQEDLTYMNRAHNAVEASAALRLAKQAGFNDFSIDLIYGGHTTSDQMWIDNIEKTIIHDPNHISAYCMTIEDGTAFGSWSKLGKIASLDDEKSNRQYEALQSHLANNGYLHYEISNFAKEGHLAVHNSNYWRGNHYLGIGPAAHSYNTVTRSWNVAHNAKYMQAIKDGIPPQKIEHLSIADQYNEYVMTSIRTSWGIDSDKIKETFGDVFNTHFNGQIKDSWLLDKIIIEDNSIKLTSTGKNFADDIAARLFYE